MNRGPQRLEQPDMDPDERCFIPYDVVIWIKVFYRWLTRYPRGEIK